jgi:heterodisulfide reductase subunit B
MSVLYMPGCTLKNKASNFDISMTASMKKLGVELQELGRWNCCGTVFSMDSDDLMKQMAPLRNLIRAEEQGPGPLLTPCSMCYNTLKRAQVFAAEDPERVQKLNDFMYDEERSYQGKVELVHPLAYLRDEIGFDQVQTHLVKPLKGAKLAAYYGCLLTRPENVSIDAAARPRVFEDLIEALGAEATHFELREECCGSYQTLTNLAVTLERTYRVLASAASSGAQALVTSCPLCAYNLDQMQREAVKEYSDLTSMPVFYFTELLALALGVGWQPEWAALHGVDPKAFLESLGFC